jgi:hypothetical protein
MPITAVIQAPVAREPVTPRVAGGDCIGPIDLTKNISQAIRLALWRRKDRWWLSLRLRVAIDSQTTVTRDGFVLPIDRLDDLVAALTQLRNQAAERGIIEGVEHVA